MTRADAWTRKGGEKGQRKEGEKRWRLASRSLTNGRLTDVESVSRELLRTQSEKGGTDASSLPVRSLKTRAILRQRHPRSNYTAQSAAYNAISLIIPRFTMASSTSADIPSSVNQYRLNLHVACTSTPTTALKRKPVEERRVCNGRERVDQRVRIGVVVFEDGR